MVVASRVYLTNKRITFCSILVLSHFVSIGIVFSFNWIFNMAQILEITKVCILQPRFLFFFTFLSLLLHFVFQKNVFGYFFPAGIRVTCNIFYFCFH